MFDLFRSRDKVVRFLLGGMLVVVAVSMLLYLVPGYGSGADSSDPVVAEVGRAAITQRQVQAQMQNLIKNRQIPAQVLGVYVPQVIDQMVSERAMAYEARRMGFEVSDSELADTIRAIGGGRFTDAATYKAFVVDQGYTVPEFESMLREGMLSSRLEAMAAKTVVVTPAEVQTEFSHRNDKVKLAYMVFDETSLKSKINPTEAELQSYFNQHRATYKVPEQRTAAVLVADQAKVAESIQVTDEQLRAAYNQNLDTYRTPERVKVRHILLTTTGKSKDEVAQIRQKIDGTLKQLKGGADFAELAKKDSQDPGSAQNGGDLGWIVKGQTVKNFENAAFSLKPNQLSDIVTTEYGFHILQVLDHQDARIQPFDEVKAALADTLKKQMVNGKLQAIADQAHADLVKAPQNMQQIAQKYGLTVVNTPKMGPADPVPGMVSPQLSSAIASLQKNAVSAPVQVGSEKLAVAVCTDVIPSRPAELSDVINQVRSAYAAAQILKLESDYGAKAAEELKSGKDIQAIAKSLGVEVKTPEPFAAIGAVEGFGPAGTLGDLASKRVGDVIGPVAISNKTLVGKIVEKISGDPAQLAAQRESIIAQLKGRKAQEAASLFEDSVRAKLTQEGKIKVNRDVVTRIQTAYNRT